MRPLLHGDAGTILFNGPAGAISRGGMRASAAALAAELPPVPQLINLCEDRARFAVVLAAASARGIPVLLPPARDARSLAALRREHPQALLLADPGGNVPAPESRQALRVPEPQATGDGPIITCTPESLAVTAFTSGSTGEPRPMHKRWGALASVAEMIRSRFQPQPGNAPGVIATVPPQHMYGLECSILMPLFCAWQVSRGQPFFPTELQALAQEQPGPWLLVTTPVHLRALLAARPRLDGLVGIISATAPMDQALASAAESCFGVPLLEIYGCTETGAIASRRTTGSRHWQLYEGIRIVADGDYGRVSSAHLAADETLPDLLRVISSSEFELMGRPADMLKVGGKRYSVAELERCMLGIDGVSDVAVLVPDAAPGREPRPAALVVADGQPVTAIRAALAQMIDPVFLPRPIRCVTRIPRNATGKTQRQILLRLLRNPD